MPPRGPKRWLQACPHHVDVVTLPYELRHHVREVSEEHNALIDWLLEYGPPATDWYVDYSSGKMVTFAFSDPRMAVLVKLKLSWTL